VINQPLVPSALSDESKNASAELALADAIARGLRRHRNASAGYDATAAKNPKTTTLESSPDFVTSFHLPVAPAQAELLTLRAHLPVAPALVPLATGKLAGEQLIVGRAAEIEGTASNIGVLIVHLGAPDAAKPAAIWRFLRESANDPRVIEIGSSFWKRSFLRRIAVSGVVLPMRSWRRTRRYRKMRIRASSQLPLRSITRSQAEKLTGILGPLGKRVVVDWGLRYAEPSIAARLEALVARRCDRILVVPLYPQFSALTTATICDQVFRFLIGMHRQPALRIMPAYYDDPHYIELLASSLSAELKKLPFEPEVIVASYQNLPQEYLRDGDPYRGQCAKTTQLLRDYLKIDEKKLMMTYHPRFGHVSSLRPSTIEAVKTLAKNGVKNLVLMTPEFCGDGLETLQEITSEAGSVFKRHGGENFASVPCLNDSEAGMLLITRLAMRELEGWV
jgi:protoporphyrin/coproporphyrin ferrochelatase